MSEENEFWTAGELAEELAGYPEDTIVLLSSDGEGNEISPIADVSTGVDEENDNAPAIVLWPI